MPASSVLPSSSFHGIKNLSGSSRSRQFNRGLHRFSRWERGWATGLITGAAKMKFLKDYPLHSLSDSWLGQIAWNNSMKRTLINWFSVSGKLTCTTAFSFFYSSFSSSFSSLSFSFLDHYQRAARIFKRIIPEGEG